MAHRYFKTGQDYLAQVQNLRCRMTGYLYIARFETALEAIERDGYRLRATYPECKTIGAGISIGKALLSKAFTRDRQQSVSRPLPAK